MYYKKFDDLTFSDHYIFEKVLQDKTICTELLERLLHIKIDHIEYPEIEKTISPYYETKGIRLDVYLKNSDKVFDIELQNAQEMDLAKRTRYYQSMVDVDNLLKGQHYSQLPESFILFICTFDPFDKDLPVYTFKNFCEEEKTLNLNDKTIKKFYNAKSYAKEKDVALKAFLEYIESSKPVDDFTDRIETLVKTIKQQETNRKEYSTVNLHEQDIYFKAKNEGIAQGAEQAKLETARNFIDLNVPYEQIAQGTGLPLETVKELAKEVK